MAGRQGHDEETHPSPQEGGGVSWVMLLGSTRRRSLGMLTKGFMGVARTTAWLALHQGRTAGGEWRQHEWTTPSHRGGGKEMG